MALDSQLKDGYKRAADNFKDSMPADLAKRFAKQTNNLASLKDEIKTIQDDHGKKGSLRNLPRLQKFVEAMNQLGQVIEVFVNANDLVCFIWGPMKFLLGIAKAHLDNFDKLLDVYAQIGDVIPGLLFYQDMFIQHEPLRDVLQDYYSDILKFHEAAIKVFTRSKWKDIFHATWKTFNTQFDPIMKSLVKRGELLESVKLSASLDHVHIIRRQISDMYQEQIRTADEKTQEKHLSRMALIKEKLRAPEYFLDQEIATQRRDGDDSGQWIFGEPEYLSWSDINALNHSVLYMNGIPGAGKTTLVSLIISKLLEVHTPNRSLSSSVSYFYFKHGDDERNSHESFLRAILTQLISQNMTSSQEFFEDFSKQADVTIRSRESLETLTEKALEEFRVSYLVLDGLDECERKQARRTVEWLLSLLGHDKYVDKTSLRILFSGQRDGLLDDVLSDFPNIRLESTKHNADIERYCLQYASKRQKRFRLNKDLETHIASLVTKGAQGMFLYARVVLDYLFRQVSLKELKNAISPDIFPSKLETAYQRIATSVLEAEYESETVAARKILSLVVTAKRDLRWREIQAFFCIDSKEGTIDPDSGLLAGAKELCGSLVDLHHVNGRMSEPESVVRIVHNTAQRYLIEKKIVDDCLENARLLTFCSDYLRSMPFAQSNRSDVVSLHARQAYYSLQDYAVAHWYDHLKTLIRPSPARQKQIPEVVQELQRATDSAASFLQEYSISSEMTETNDTEVSLETILNRLPHDDSERTSLLNIGQRTSWIRREIENLAGLTNDEIEILNNLYGPISRFKCHKPKCLMFTEGFATTRERTNHTNRHDRPFRCNQEGCFAHVFGFDSTESLNKHVNDYHSEAGTSLQFPPQDSHTAPPPNGNRIIPAVINGDIARVTQLLDEGSDINARSTTAEWNFYTPLWQAANCNHYQICELLIQKGADLGKPATFRPKRKKFAKVDTMSACTPLAQACVRENIKIVDLILKAYRKANTFANSGIRIALMKATMRGNLEIVQLLTTSYDFTQDKDPEDGPDDPLLVACERSHFSVLDFLLQIGFEFKAGVNYFDTYYTAGTYHKKAKERREMTLRVMLASGKLRITSAAHFNLAADFKEPSIVFMILSYPGTNLSAADLKDIRTRAEAKSYTDIIKLADKLLAALDQKDPVIPVKPAADPLLDDKILNDFDFESFLHEDGEDKPAADPLLDDKILNDFDFDSFLHEDGEDLNITSL